MIEKMEGIPTNYNLEGLKVLEKKKMIRNNLGICVCSTSPEGASFLFLF